MKCKINKIAETAQFLDVSELKQHLSSFSVKVFPPRLGGRGCAICTQKLKDITII
jgi:hypothetical protein